MKKLCETVGFLVFAQGAAGLLHDWTGWFRFLTVVRRVGFVGQYGTFVDVVLVVTGVAVMVASDAIKE